MSTKLTIRVAAPSIVISLLLLASGSVGGWYVHHLQKSTAQLVALDMATIHAVQQLVLGVIEMRAETTDYLLTSDRAHLNALPEKCAQAEHWLAEAERLVDDENEQELVARIRAGYQRFLAEARRLADAPPDAHTKKAVERLNAELGLRDVLTPARELLAMEEDLVHQSGDYNQSLARQIAWELWLLGACGSVAGLVAGFGIARSVSRSIVELYMPIQAASGRLEEVVGPVDLTPAAGIEKLDGILRTMADHVGTVVDRLQQSQLEVLRAEQMAALGQLAAGLAHELRNPLTSMKILIQAAVEAEPGASIGGRDLAVLLAETIRLERSIQTFLDFARPPKLEKCSGDIRDVIQQTLELVSARANRQDVEIRYDPPERPIILEADHEQLRQLLLNLMINALDTLPSGGKVEIAVAEAAEAVTITVADSGPGIPEHLRDRIFEPYVSTKDTGLGLGLAICRRIAETHGGQITADRGPAGGAMFTVRLPKNAGDNPSSSKEVSCSAC